MSRFNDPWQHARFILKNGRGHNRPIIHMCPWSPMSAIDICQWSHGACWHRSQFQWRQRMTLPFRLHQTTICPIPSHQHRCQLRISSHFCFSSVNLNWSQHGIHRHCQHLKWSNNYHGSLEICISLFLTWLPSEIDLWFHQRDLFALGVMKSEKCTSSTQWPPTSIAPIPKVSETKTSPTNLTHGRNIYFNHQFNVWSLVAAARRSTIFSLVLTCFWSTVFWSFSLSHTHTYPIRGAFHYCLITDTSGGVKW